MTTEALAVPISIEGPIHVRILAMMLRTLLAASAALLPLPAAALPASADPFAGDRRLDAKLSTRQLNRPIRDLLADLNQQTGVAFFADARLPDDRVTLITHDRSAAETLRAVAKLFQYEWTRDGKAASPAYRLSLSDAARKAEAEAARTRSVTLAAEIAREVRLFRELAALPPEQRDTLSGEVAMQLGREKDPAKAAELRARHAILQQFVDGSNRKYWLPVIIALMETLTPAQVEELTRAGSLTFATPEVSACLPVPQAVRPEVERAGKFESGLTGSYRGIVHSLRIRLTYTPARRPYVRWDLLVALRSSQYATATRFMGSVPADNANAAPFDGQEKDTAPADWSSDPALATPVTFTLGADLPAAVRFSGRIAPYRLSDALAKLDEARPLDVVADGFWSTRIPGADMRAVPVGEALTRIARSCGHRWWKEDGFVMLQTRALPADRDAEPPATAVARWVELNDSGLFGLDELAEVASLPDARGNTLLEMGTAGLFPVMLSPSHPGRAHLVLWNGLDRAQRRTAIDRGLAYADLPAAAKRLYLLAASDPGSPQTAFANATEEVVAKSRLRVILQEKECWGVRRSGAESTWQIERSTDGNLGIGTRAEALRRFQQLDASIKEAEVQAMVRAQVQFQYEGEMGVFARTLLNLPPRWDGPPPGSP
jgi:hypothetical protein